MGHQVSEAGIETDPEKVAAIKDWPQPRTVKEVQQFVGLASYYRKFIPSFATVCKPLHKLTEKDQKFVWNDETQSAFDTIKRLLTTAPVLSYVDPEGTGFVLDCDASNVGIGSVLHQLQNGEERVIGYFSRCLTRAERKYCTTRKELLAVVASVKHFHTFLYGQEFVIRSDHGSLRWIMNFRNTGEGQLARFLETLSSYSFKLKFRAGRMNSNADAVSRRPCYADNCPYCERYEAKYCPDLSETRSSKTSAKIESDECVRKLSYAEQNCSENGAPCRYQCHDYVCTQTQVMTTDTADIKCLTCRRYGTTDDIVSNEMQNDDARLYCSKDSDPYACIGPIFNDDTLTVGEACTTSSLGQRVTSGVSDETAPREFTDRAPSPVRNACNDTVDERTHKIHYVSCVRPDIRCSQVAHHDDWLDRFEEEPLFGYLFESEQQEVAQVSSQLDSTDDSSTLSHDRAVERKPSTLFERVSDCQNVGHAGMLPTREVTHEDTVHHPGEDYLPCESKLSNRHPSDLLQTGLSCSTKNSDSNCKDTVNECTNQSTKMSSRAVDGASVNRAEISQESIRFEQANDPILQQLLQWKRAGNKPDWAMIAHCCRELKIYWYQWDTIEIKDEILCKKQFTVTGTDYLYIIPISLRKEVFRHLHEYITGGHLGSSKTYDKLKRRFYWCNMHRDVAYWCRICPTCGSRKLPPRRAKAPMRQYNVGFPMERIAIDLSGPYPVSKKGNKYLMVISDYFTKWTEAIPLRSQEATSSYC